MADRRLRILSVNTYESGAGGAGRVANDLCQGLRARDHLCWQAVKIKESGSDNVFRFDGLVRPSLLARLRSNVECVKSFLGENVPGALQLWKIRREIGRIINQAGEISRAYPALRKIKREAGRVSGQVAEFLSQSRGRENFDFPATWNLFGGPVESPDLVHLHNLHGEYFDLRALPWLTARQPTFVTLHDMWMLTGHCAQSIDCDRWKTGCGQCPYLNIYPAMEVDRTAKNLRCKTGVYAKSRLYVAAPSLWLLNQARASILAPAIVESRVIPNGIDTSIFHVRDKREARTALDIDPDAHVLLYVASDPRTNPFKDYETLLKAVNRIVARMPDQKIVFLALGENATALYEQRSKIGHAELRLIRFQSDPRNVARYYHAADVCLHAAKAETFGLVIAEAAACGTPVVATHVCGIPELIRDAQTGYLVPPRDPEAMAARVTYLLQDGALRQRMSRAAAAFAASQFNRDKMVERYLDWYAEVTRRTAGAFCAGNRPVAAAA
jgi:glycosyltransferase involved in cell wall biosynthesis